MILKIYSSKYGLALRKMLRRAHVDRPVFFGFLSIAKGFVAGPITALLIATWFTREVQGFFYTFGSVLALGVFIELGLSQVIVQFASHEWSRLSLGKDRRIVGDPDALSRLVSIGHFAMRWYAAGSILVVTGISGAGYYFFSHSPHAGVHWVAPWIVVCVVSGISMNLMPYGAVLEGCNQVADVYLLNLIGGLLSTLAIWCSIILGANLWTSAVVATVGLIWQISIYAKRYRHFFAPFWQIHGGPRIDWREAMWPMQWRIALSWISGYFCFQLFNPVLLHYRGPIEAGQMGMTWGLCNFLIGIASLWLLPKAPKFGLLIAQKKYEELDRLFFGVTGIAMAVSCLGAAGGWSIIYFVNRLHLRIAARVLPLLPTALFLIATVVMQFLYAMGIYLRAHKKEPLAGVSVTAGILTGLSTWLLGMRFGAIGMATGYLAINVLFGLPAVFFVFRRCRAQWHAPAGEPLETLTAAANP